MKKKFSKILGVGLTLVMVFALTVGFALPVGASPDENEWSTFDYPIEGEDGGWFYSPDIGAIGPIAQAINGDLYLYAGIGSVAELDAGTNHAEWSTTEKVSGSSSAKLDLADAHICVDFTPAAGTTLTDLEALTNGWGFWYHLTAAPGPQLELKFALDPADFSTDFVDITVMAAQGTHATTGEWTEVVLADDLISVGYWGPDILHDPGAGQTLAEAIAEVLADPDIDGDWELARVRVELYESTPARDCYIDDVRINGVTYDLEGVNGSSNDGTALGSYLMISDDDGRTWEETDYAADTGGSTIVDIACSSIDEETVYVTDGALVYKSEDTGDSWAAVADVSLTTALGDLSEGAQTITSLAVGYDRNDDPLVFVGSSDVAATYDGGVLYIAEEGYPSVWTNLEFKAYNTLANTYDVMSLAVSPEFRTTKEIIAVVTKAGDTDVVSNVGVSGGWSRVSHLVASAITGASDICFPDDYDDTETLFVGIAGATGTLDDVYLVTDTPYDLNVAGTAATPTQVTGLDILGETEEATLVAGTTGAVVYYSTNGGYDWDETDKVPSGATNALPVISGDSVFAATSGTECALSLSVDGGALFNQISLISTDIDQVTGVAFSNEYATDETMFLLTRATTTNDSLFRYDGTNWERVADTTVLATVIADTVGAIGLVGISPDYTTDTTVFLGDGTPQIFYTNDAGNEWDDMRYDPGFLSSWLIIDGDTIIVGGVRKVQQTTRSGSRPWETAEVVATNAGTIVSIAKSGDSILAGDTKSQVFISPDGELDEFEQVDTVAIGAAGNTFVAFDGDIIYAASGEVVSRCVIDPDEDWADQEWEEFTVLPTHPTDATLDASGIVLSADGTLYVADATAVAIVTETGYTSYTNGGMVRSLNPDEEDVDDAVFERVNIELADTTQLALAGFTAGSNVIWATDGAAAPATENLWTYEDTLTTAVVLSSPVSGMSVSDTNEATLEWFELTGAEEYQVTYDTSPDFDVDPIDEYTDDLEVTVEELDSGTTYYWKVRVAEGEPLLSRWSEVRSFFTALTPVYAPLVWIPESGATDVSVSPSFMWEGVDGATNYKIMIATDSTFAVTSRVVEVMVTTNAYACDVRLGYNTIYYWRVKAYSDSVGVSAWTTGMFTTMAKPVPATPPVEITPPSPAPDVIVEVPPAIEVIIPAAQVISPTWIYVIIGVGAVLAIAVVVLIVRTRRVA